MYYFFTRKNENLYISLEDTPWRMRLRTHSNEAIHAVFSIAFCMLLWTKFAVRTYSPIRVIAQFFFIPSTNILFRLKWYLNTFRFSLRIFPLNLRWHRLFRYVLCDCVFLNYREYKILSISWIESLFGAHHQLSHSMAHTHRALASIYWNERRDEKRLNFGK